MDSNDPNNGASVAYLELTPTEFDALSAPTEDDQRTMIRVLDDTGRAGFMAYGRKTIDGDPEWYVTADRFQVWLVSGAYSIASPETGSPHEIGDAAVDLTGYTECKFSTYVTDASGAVNMKVKMYDPSGSLGDLTATGETIPFATTGFKETDWAPISAASQVQLKAEITAGDFSDDIAGFNVIVHFQR